MLLDSYSSVSNALSLSLICLIGIAVFSAFAFLVTRSRDLEVRRRWRFSILSGVVFGIFGFVMFCCIFLASLYSDESKLGFMVLVKYPRSSIDVISGLVLFIAYPLLINLPMVFLVTLGVYWKQLGMGDMFIDQLLYPVKKHPSDQSPNNILDKARAFIAKLING